MALFLVTAALTSAWAQGASIFTCTDAQGRRLTSDRIIPQCLDREQYELNPSGTVRRVIPPSLTAEERARAEARQRAEAEVRQKEAEERRRNQVMLIRFPNEAAHQRAREDALRPVHAVIAAVVTREADLDKQRQEILAEMEFYLRDPSRAPAWLQHRQATNQQQIASQRTFREDQEREISRINQRFDEELALLQRLWRERDQAASR
jgi:vacuolar-type H+-ATPase subunit I/STV1